ncbi:MAG: hypothetical protein WCC11_08735 [Gammaproteobacteria bacterium]
MGEKIDFLSVTAEEAEREELLRGIRMNTQEKFEYFEEILNLAWRMGVIEGSRKSDKSGSGWKR